MNFENLFPDNREVGETPLRQTQLVMLRLLKIFDYLCDKHGVEYFLIGGSAIGAVRHNGFIPWDDDIDVGMTRNNYDIFVEKCVPELPNDIFFQTSETDTHYPKFGHVDAKLRDKYSSYKHLDGTVLPFHDGFQLDIFIFDKAFLPSKVLIILQNIIINTFSKSISNRKKILAFISKIAPSYFVFGNNWQHELGMLKLNVGPLFAYADEIKTLSKIKFEDTYVFVPVGVDTMLKRQFGNYMKLPPVEKRFSHHGVELRPFEACNHKEILSWQHRNK